MSSPSSAGGNNSSVGIREGTRVILREITANLQNSPPGQSPRRKSGNEASSIKGEQQQQQQQHDVKVRFIREFADAGASSVREANTESSLSSASSFQSLTSTLSSKCSSGICVDSSPAKASDTSYLSADIPGLDDIISACENIRLTDKTLDLSKDQSFNLQLDAAEVSVDQTFTSAVDRSLDRTRDLSDENSSSKFQPDVTQDLNRTRELSARNSPVNFQPDVTQELNRTRELSAGISSVDFQPDVTRELNRTGELSARNSPVNLPPDVTQELYRTGELIAANSPTKLAEDVAQDLNRTREISACNSPTNFTENVVQELDSTRTIDEETDTSVANAFVERATVDATEATRYHQANSELGSVNETFVQCVSDIAQVEPAHCKNARDDLQVAELAKSEEIPVKSEITGENKSNDDSPDNKIEDSTPFDEYAGNSTVTLESLADLIAEDAAVLQKEIQSVGTSQRSDIVEKPARSLLDVTVDIPSDLSEFHGIEPSNFEGKEPIHLESLSDLVIDDITSVDSLERYKPLAPGFSEIHENSQCPSLPTLSSVCLRATFAETDDSVEKKPVEDLRSTADIVPTVVGPSLSEKFANIAATDVSPLNSISTIKEPTFLNAQKLVDDFTDASDVKSEEIIEDIVKTAKQTRETVKNVENKIELPEIEFCEFKKPELPVQRAAGKVVPPELPKTEVKERKIEISDKDETEKQTFLDIVETREADSSAGTEELNETVTIQDISAGNIFAVAESDQYAEFLPQQQSTALTLEKKSPRQNFPLGPLSTDNLITKPFSLPDEYAAFLPQQQSTTLKDFDDRPVGKLVRQPTPFVTASLVPEETLFNGENSKSPKKPALPIDDRCDFDKLELAAKAVANDIYKTSLELEDENNLPFVSATSELFHDPGSFDFLLSKTPRKNTRRDLRAESLYVKFDPLVSNTSMLPQGNIQNASPPANEEQNGDNNTTIGNIGTPKRNPAIAAIDRLLFYSPMTTTTTPTSNTASIQKTNDSSEKVEPTEETSAEKVNMAKELELVRSTVIQLEEQLEKLKIDHEEALEKQSSYQEKINELQTQLAQEIKKKNQITVVVDEYEKSISRLVAEREHDRKNLDLEKAKLQEELAAAKHHLDNTEAAFNDVHLKYERLKAVVATYKSNEVALKQSVQENVDIIKSLENRYEQVKEHATARLEKANQDLDSIRKQNESETVRLHAMLRKAELKSNSLAELVEQKTKENKELTQILDEVIARVGRNKSD